MTTIYARVGVSTEIIQTIACHLIEAHGIDVYEATDKEVEQAVYDLTTNDKLSPDTLEGSYLDEIILTFAAYYGEED